MMSKYITKGLVAMLMLPCVGALMQSCSDDDPFFAATADDSPRILNSEFGTAQEGGYFTFANITRDKSFSLDIVVTPAEYTTVYWYFDGEESHVGKEIDTLLLAGVYDVRIEAVTTKGLSTYRNGTVTVNALDGDPVVGEDAMARLLSSGKLANLPGTNLDKVRKVSINGQQTDATYVDGALQFTTPSMADGKYRLVLIDDKGQQYGGGFITVTSQAYVLQSSVTAKSKGDVTFTGINLDRVSKVTIGNAIATIKSKEYGQLVVTMPDLAVGDYTLTAQTEGGKEVSFGGNSSCTVTITSETLLWEGTAVINWDASILHFTPAQMADVPVGSKINIYYNVPEAEYHNLRIVTSWWNDVPGGAQIDVTDSTPNPYVLTYTKEFKDMVDGQDGWSPVGFGYTVTKVTYE